MIPTGSYVFPLRNSNGYATASLSQQLLLDAEGPWREFQRMVKVNEHWQNRTLIVAPSLSGQLIDIRHVVTNRGPGVPVKALNKNPYDVRIENLALSHQQAHNSSSIHSGYGWLTISNRTVKVDKDLLTGWIGKRAWSIDRNDRIITYWRLPNGKYRPVTLATYLFMEDHTKPVLGTNHSVIHKDDDSNNFCQNNLAVTYNKKR